MRRLLLGRSGSGKTRRVIEYLAARAKEDPTCKLFLLVPEQYSFETERTLLRTLGADGAGRVRVLSFTRLAQTVFREVGGLAGESLDDGSRALLMSRALEQIAGVYADQGKKMPGTQTDPAYVIELLGLLKEFRQCAVSTAEIEQAAQDIAADTPLMAEKIARLCDILSAYEGLTAGRDDLELLTRLKEKLTESTLPAGAVFTVDGFKGFTAQELDILEGLLPRAVDILITLSTDTAGTAVGLPGDLHEREFSLFSPVIKTVGQLREMAARHHQEWEICLEKENRRAVTGGLRALERGLYAPCPAVYEGEAPEITVTPCADIYEECAYVARSVRRLVRQEGYRLREITVVARQVADYAGILDDALEREGIPCNIDRRQELLCEPLMALTRCALRIAVGGFKTEEILRLLKTDLGPLDPTRTAMLENYLYMWRIDGAAWEAPFTENPGGLDARMTPENARRLAELNEWRQSIVDPLARLRQSLRGGTDGRRFALAVYTYLTADKDMPERIRKQASRLEELGEPLLAEHALRMWDEIIGILDRFALALGDQRLPAARLEELFTMLAQTVDMGSIPQGLDAVTVGGADRIRYSSPRAVFVVGANEGVFPAYPADSGILGEEERDALKDHGITLAGDVLEQCMEERYFVYMAVSAPSERLTVTYLADADNAPSPLVESINGIVPGHRKGTAVLGDGTDLEGAEEMFRRLATDYTHPTALTASLQQVIAEQPVFASRMAAVARSAAHEPFRLQNAATARELFGSDMCLSASQTEKYYQCGFSYFCNYGLKIRPRKVAQMDAGVFGTVVHHVMEVLVQRYSRPGDLIDRLREEETALRDADEAAYKLAEVALQERLLPTIREAVAETVAAYLEQMMGGAGKKSGQFLYQVELAKEAAAQLLWVTLNEMRQSEFRPADFELRILPQEDPEKDGILSMRLPVPEGSIRLTGKIDRVDLYVRFDGQAFVRVVDYKTGGTTFALHKLAAGLNTQMLLYLFILCDNSRRYLEEAGELRPAGVLYRPSAGDELTGSRRQMDGLVLEDPAVIMAMEKKAKKVYIPAEIGKDGSVKGNVINARQFGLLRGVVEDLLVQMGTSLLAGDISALPLTDGEYSPCTYCDYRAVCCHEEDDPSRAVVKRPPEELFAGWADTDGSNGKGASSDE